MSGPALSVSGVRGELDLAALAERRLELRIDVGQLFLTPEAVALLLPPAAPLRVEGFGPGRLHLRVTGTLLPFSLELEATASPSGRLLLRPQGLAGMLAGLFSGALRDMLRGKPGLSEASGSIELDIAELLLPLGIHLPPLRAVRVESTGALLQFR